MASSARRSRRDPRPTIRFLQMLPLDSFGDAEQAKQIQMKQWTNLDIGTVRHPLVEDAKRRFAQGLPDVHRTASAAAGRKVYEVRSRTGAAWRGAVVCDEDGDPWLVWAAKHDEFHHEIPNFARRIDNLLPAPVEYKLRAREEALHAHSQWCFESATALLDAVSQVMRNPGTVEQFWIPANPSIGGIGFSVQLAIEHEPPSDRLETGISTATIRLSVNHEAEAFISTAIPMLQPDGSLIDSTFTKGGGKELWITVEHSRLAQLLAANESTNMLPTDQVRPGGSDRLHFVQKVDLLEGLVYSQAARAICGAWFVPSRGEDVALPICDACERILPVASLTDKLIRQALER